MNLLITDRCNRSCPYCFAKGKVALSDESPPTNPTGTGHITLENVLRYLEFLQNSHDHQLRLLGGEPTLHPQLDQIIDLGLSRGFDITIFTNGLWPNRVQSYFSANQDRRISFVINVNAPDTMTPKEIEALQTCLPIAGTRAWLGFNIYTDDFDLLFLADMIDRFDLKREIRVGLAGPIVGKNNDHIDSSALKRAGKRLVKQFRQLESKDILGQFDCGFPLCMFDEGELGGLALSFTHGFSSLCGCPIDVDSNLNAWHCFPLSTIANVRLADFRDKDEIVAYYRRLFAPLHSFGSMEECIACRYLKRGQCTGGCLGRTIKSIKSSGDPLLVSKLNAQCYAGAPQP